MNARPTSDRFLAPAGAGAARPQDSGAAPAAARADERALLERLIEHAPHAVAVTRGESHVVRCANAAFCSLMGVAPDELLGRPYGDAFPEPAAEAAPLALLDRAYRSAQAESDRELVRRRADGERVVWSYTAWPLPDAAGGVDGLVVEVRDRTAAAESHRRLEEVTGQIRQINERLLTSAVREQEWAEKAEAAAKAKSDFLAMMSHELRTPLTAIVGYTDVLDAGIPGPVNEQQRESLQRIRICSDQLLDLIGDVLSFAQMQAQSVPVRCERVDVCHLARQVTEMVEPSAARKPLELRVVGPPAPVLIETDPGKLRQILLNLVANAVKFTDTGEVRVDVHEEPDHVRCTVTDTGIGISAADLERIFEPFVQTEEITTRRFGGTGLGLAISRTLALTLGGELSVRSTPGEGSAFCLRLPRSGPPAGRDDGPLPPRPDELNPLGSERP